MKLRTFIYVGDMTVDYHFMVYIKNKITLFSTLRYIGCLILNVVKMFTILSVPNEPYSFELPSQVRTIQ